MRPLSHTKWRMMPDIRDNRAEKHMFALVFAECIRDLRHKTGIAQEALAHKAGVDRGYMSVPSILRRSI